MRRLMVIIMAVVMISCSLGLLLTGYTKVASYSYSLGYIGQRNTTLGKHWNYYGLVEFNFYGQELGFTNSHIDRELEMCLAVDTTKTRIVVVTGPESFSATKVYPLFKDSSGVFYAKLLSREYCRQKKEFLNNYAPKLVKFGINQSAL
jgi:hypothetical protein